MLWDFTGSTGLTAGHIIIMFFGAVGVGIFGGVAYLLARVIRGEFAYDYMQRRFEKELPVDIAVETYRRGGYSVSRIDGVGTYPMFVAKRAGTETIVCIDAKSSYAFDDFIPHKSFETVKAMREHMGAAGIKSGLWVSEWDREVSLNECTKAAGIRLVSVRDLGMMAYRTRRRGDVIVKEPEACKRCGIAH